MWRCNPQKGATRHYPLVTTCHSPPCCRHCQRHLGVVSDPCWLPPPASPGVQRSPLAAADSICGGVCRSSHLPPPCSRHRRAPPAARVTHRSYFLQTIFQPAVGCFSWMNITLSISLIFMLYFFIITSVFQTQLT